MSIITLLTDFGTGAEYAGLMKGVILSINPSATIVDITHHIDSQDIVQAAFTICVSYEYFPDGTVQTPAQRDIHAHEDRACRLLG